MKRLKLIKKNIIINPLKYTVAFLAGLIFASTAVYAWSAVWHGTDWIKSGEVIRAKEVGENMQYLYEQVEDLKSQITNLQTTINNNATTTTSIDCPSRYPGWPDVIRCEYRRWGKLHTTVYLRITGLVDDDATGYVGYYDDTPTSGPNSPDGRLIFRKNGTIYYKDGSTGDCGSLTMQQLKAMGRTYNICMKPSQ